MSYEVKINLETLSTFIIGVIFFEIQYFSLDFHPLHKLTQNNSVA